jgi:type II secretory pathway pseudopilin PulG
MNDRIAFNRTSVNRPRAGFTAIEMMVVVSIIIVLVAMVVPTIGPAMKKGSVHDAASAIQRACSQARQLARSSTEPRVAAGMPPSYGVSVVVPAAANQPAYAVVIYGNRNPSDYSFASQESNQYPNGTPALDGTGTISGMKAAARFPFNRGVMPVTAPGAVPPAIPNYALMGTNTAVGWYYQYRTGFVFNNVAQWTKAVDIGVNGSGAMPEAFGVASLNMKYIVAISIYKIGLLNAQDAN